MKIRDFEVTPLTNRGLLLQVHTDEGITGIGAPMNYEHGRTVERAIFDMSEYLIGRDPLQIEDHWQTLYRSSYSRQMPILVAALSGLEFVIAFLQAYVFAILTCLYINDALHLH